MPRIDPQQLLLCLTPLLAPNGGIKSNNEVIRLANLMEKYSKKLVSKCIYIQILKCTETELLGQYMAAGGWSLVHNWLQDGSNSNNWPFVQELLEMLLLCPVDGNRLKSNHTPKIIKNLSLTCSNQTVKILSSKLVEQWLRIAHLEKQQLAAVNGIQNGINGTNEMKLMNGAGKENKVVLQNEVSNGQIVVSDPKSEDDTSKKQSSENVKYKVSNKEGSGKLLLSLKRSTSPNSVDEKDSKSVRSTSVESKSKSSSSSSSSDNINKEKEKSKKSSSSSSSHKSSSSSSKSSHRDKDRSSSSSSSHRKSSSSSSKDKSKSSSSSKHSSSSSSSSSRDKDKDKDKEREKRKKESEKSQAEKDKETLNLVTPLPSSKLQRIPKRQHSDNSENKSSELNKELPHKIPKTENVEKKKPSISIEVRKGDKPKTVKTLNSQFRNHGLAEEPPKPPSRKDLKKPATTAVTLTSLPSSISSKSSAISPPPSKKLHLEKALDTDNVPERVGGVKLIKPKPMIVESIGFMDALDASANSTKKDSKKRKRLPSNSKKDEPESPKVEAKPLKFYKDTLEENDEEQTNGEKSPTKELESDEKKAKKDGQVDGDKSPEQATEKKEGEKSSEDVESKADKSPEFQSEESTINEKRRPGVGCGPEGPSCVLVDPNLPRRKKRSIRWRPDEELTETRYFELDETERTNVSKTFTEQKQIEHVGERSAFLLGRKMQNEDTMAEQTTWRSLIIVDNVPEINYGSKSQEVKIQAERERNVLQELYFRHSINDSPHEPDPESYDHVEPQIIPLEDPAEGNNPDAFKDFTAGQWPAPKTDLQSTLVPSAFGGIFNQISIPPATPLGLPPSLGLNPIVNPLASFPPLGIHQNQPAPNAMWMIPPTNFVQQPPPFPPQLSGFGNRIGMNNNNNNNFRGNGRPHNNINNNNNGNWVRGNARRGICNQFQRTGMCRNKNCPYIHER
ncbi:CLUMA_CG007524, isoform A [Clunio marinus]|uniref:CLUMA_CG007524, isoform A n=1 Tax=Clunio marinus TaxID=568069 RepID=A0A1J1I513_9DIPT|nr:CLUMA_CG007524, isoform A [Clunio marinus]